jgi:hypothetical protein
MANEMLCTHAITRVEGRMRHVRNHGGGGAVTLASRLALKRSMDSGEGEVVDASDKRSKSLSNLIADCDDTFDTFNKTMQLGSGVYGDVRLLSEQVVAKVVGCGPHLLGSYLQSPFRSEQCEGALLNFLWMQLVETPMRLRNCCITPHIIAPFAKASILAGATNKTLKENAEVEASAVLFLERATRNDMRSYLGGIWNQETFDLHFRVLLFQLCYTLEAIYQRWPQFRHNDFHDANMLLHQVENTGRAQYSIGGRAFCVPRIGVSVLVSDFDFACIAGHFFDNYKTLEQDWDSPSYNINQRLDQRADIYTLINYVRSQFGDRMSPTLRSSLQKLYPHHEPRSNSMRCMVGDERAPTVKELLFKSDLFRDFLAATPCDETYRADLMPDLPLAYGQPSGAHETRHCIVVKARHPVAAARLAALPSFAYFSQCPARDKHMDAEAPMLYSQVRAQPLLDALRKVYHAKPTARTDHIGYMLDPHSCDECMERIEMAARAFIDSHYLPFRWWCAAFTAAFMDVTLEMQLYGANQRCWYIGLWADFWRNQGLVNYTDLALLQFALQWSWWEE